MGKLKSWRGQRCTYCTRELMHPNSKSRTAATRDHAIPKSHGGTLKVSCCIQCNGLKGNMTPDVWAAFMELFPRWWERPEFYRGGVQLRVRTEVLAFMRTRAQPPSGDRSLGFKDMLTDTPLGSPLEGPDHGDNFQTET